MVRARVDPPRQDGIVGDPRRVHPDEPAHRAPGEVHRADVRFAERALGTYGNFTNAVAPGLPGRMYPPATLARLAALKREWDPDNLFSRNHNVLPGGS